MSSTILSLIFDQSSCCNCVECRTLKSLQFFHFIETFLASTPVHEEVDDLVDVVLLLEHDDVLLAATRSFQSFFVYFFGHNQPGVRAFESPIDSQRGFAPFVGPGES